MGIFNKMFGQKENNDQSNEINPEQHLINCKTEEELIQRFGGIALEKQIDFGEYIGDNNWNVDISKEEIYFGDTIVLPIQVLGTFSHSSETWLWAWTNSKSGLSESITNQSLQLKKYGEENEINLLRNSEFDATINDLHLIGLIASGMFNSSGYYIADYGQGAMVVTIKSEKVDKSREENHLRILTVFPQLISQFEMNHNHALTSYLTDRGYTITENGLKLTATNNEKTITAEFDELARLTKLNGNNMS
mgnify:CR=1 FL=1